MKKEQMAQREISLENGTLLTLDYWLLTDKREQGERYGIAVTDSGGSETLLPDITTSTVWRWGRSPRYRQKRSSSTFCPMIETNKSTSQPERLRGAFSPFSCPA